MDLKWKPGKLVIVISVRDIAESYTINDIVFTREAFNYDIEEALIESDIIINNLISSKV